MRRLPPQVKSLTAQPNTRRLLPHHTITQSAINHAQKSHSSTQSKTHNLSENSSKMLACLRIPNFPWQVEVARKPELHNRSAIIAGKALDLDEELTNISGGLGTKATRFQHASSSQHRPTSPTSCLECRLSRQHHATTAY
jgi:hypothetical protein